MSNRTCSFIGCTKSLQENSTPGRKYCSANCAAKASYYRRRDQINAKKRAENAALRASVVKDCKHCGTQFSPQKSLAQEFCTKRCGSNYGRDNSGKQCTVDGCTRPLRARGMCSMHWRRWARATGREKNPVWDERRKANWKKRYALTRGAVDAESFEYSEIYDRDGWVCGICNEPVDPLLEWPDPMSVSLDHVIPVTRGGSHTRENAQCSHLGCNISKGNDFFQVGAMSV